jgi:hypothetical protein
MLEFILQRRGSVGEILGKKLLFVSFFGWARLVPLKYSLKNIEHFSTEEVDLFE